ncbi:MAG TPA: hypothetical protein VMR28_03435 [Candidatus Saccharimonadales bacterium]|nr:hypothetical protein [Candidatus Saccharimonadales bacterium]
MRWVLEVPGFMAFGACVVTMMRTNSLKFSTAIGLGVGIVAFFVALLIWLFVLLILNPRTLEIVFLVSLVSYFGLFKRKAVD